MANITSEFSSQKKKGHHHQNERQKDPFSYMILVVERHKYIHYVGVRLIIPKLYSLLKLTYFSLFSLLIFCLSGTFKQDVTATKVCIPGGYRNILFALWGMKRYLRWENSPTAPQYPFIWSNVPLLTPLWRYFWIHAFFISNAFLRLRLKCCWAKSKIP